MDKRNLLKNWLIENHDGSFSNKDYHQAILNAGYYFWRNPSEIPSKLKSRFGENLGYDSLISIVKEVYGDFPALAILVGKYNQQVCNGGHIQYFENGLASYDSKGFCGDYGEDIELHKYMIELMNQFEFNEKFPQIFEIMSKFRIEIDNERYIEETCYECNGIGYFIEYDYDGNEVMESCSFCGGTGYDEYQNDDYGCVINGHELDQLDSLFYEINDKFLEEFNNLCESFFMEE